MGRPHLNLVITPVRLSADVRARIEALVGERRMGIFIREAVDHELQRREQASAKLSQGEIDRPGAPSASKPSAD
jgi:predicted transcriptional regulator